MLPHLDRQALGAVERTCITSRGGFVALEMIHDTVASAGREELERYLNAEAAEVWKYRDISRFRCAMRAVDGRTFVELNLATEDGEEDSILVSPEVSMGELKSSLLSKGIRKVGSGGDGTARAAGERSRGGHDRRGREAVSCAAMLGRGD